METWESIKALPKDQQVARVLDVMAAIVAEVGEDFRYDRPSGYDGVCRYVADRGHGYQADCLIARVLHRLGVRLDVLSEYEGNGADVLARAVGLHEDTGAVLRAAQCVQDIGNIWGLALQAARDKAARQERAHQHAQEINGDSD